MAYKGNQIEQQVKYRIKSYNRHRSEFVVVVLIGILVILPTVGVKALPIRLTVFCSIVLLQCCTAFILSSRDSLLLLLAATSALVILLFLNKIHFRLFMIFSLINVGIVLISARNARKTIRLLTDEIEAVNRLKTEAITDSLTQLLNRNGLRQAAETAWAFCKRNKKKVGVILVDIDFFKTYNDTFGHLEGDKILRHVSSSIKNCFERETDIISRTGGDEFLIFLTDIKEERILQMAQSLSSSIIDMKFKTAPENNPCGFLSVSMGVAVSDPQPEDTLTGLYKNADKALYDAKKAGRNCISFHKNIIQIEETSNNKSHPIDALTTSLQE